MDSLLAEWDQAENESIKKASINDKASNEQVKKKKPRKKKKKKKKKKKQSGKANDTGRNGVDRGGNSDAESSSDEESSLLRLGAIQSSSQNVMTSIVTSAEDPNDSRTLRALKDEFRGKMVPEAVLKATADSIDAHYAEKRAEKHQIKLKASAKLKMATLESIKAQDGSGDASNSTDLRELKRKISEDESSTNLTGEDDSTTNATKTKTNASIISTDTVESLAHFQTAFLKAQQQASIAEALKACTQLFLGAPQKGGVNLVSYLPENSVHTTLGVEKLIALAKSLDTEEKNKSSKGHDGAKSMKEECSMTSLTNALSHNSVLQSALRSQLNVVFTQYTKRVAISAGGNAEKKEQPCCYSGVLTGKLVALLTNIALMLYNRMQIRLAMNFFSLIIDDCVRSEMKWLQQQISECLNGNTKTATGGKKRDLVQEGFSTIALRDVHFISSILTQLAGCQADIGEQTLARRTALHASKLLSDYINVKSQIEKRTLTPTVTLQKIDSLLALALSDIAEENEFEIMGGVNGSPPTSAVAGTIGTSSDNTVTTPGTLDLSVLAPALNDAVTAMIKKKDFQLMESTLDVIESFSYESGETAIQTSQAIANLLNQQTKLNRFTTPLMICSGLGHIGLTTRLLEMGADPNKKDKRGKDAIGWAKQFGKQDVLKILSDKVSKASKGPRASKGPKGPKGPKGSGESKKKSISSKKKSIPSKKKPIPSKTTPVPIDKEDAELFSIFENNKAEDDKGTTKISEEATVVEEDEIDNNGASNFVGSGGVRFSFLPHQLGLKREKSAGKKQKKQSKSK